MKRLLLAALAFTFHTASSQELKLVLPEGHFSTVHLAVNRTGEVIATSGFKEQMIGVWDVHTGRLLSTLYDEGAYFGYESLKVSPDKKYVLANNQGPVVWEVYSSKRLEDLEELANANIHWGSEDVFSGDGRLYFHVADSIKNFSFTERKINTLGKHPGVKEVFTWNDLVFSISEYDQRVWFGKDSWAAYEKLWMSPADTFLAALANDTTYIFSGKGKGMSLKLVFPYRAKEVHFRPGHAEFVIVSEVNIAYLIEAIHFQPLVYWIDENIWAFDWKKRSIMKLETQYSYISTPPKRLYYIHEYFPATGDSLVHGPVTSLPERSKYFEKEYNTMALGKGFLLENELVKVIDPPSEKVQQTINTQKRIGCPCTMIRADKATKLLVLSKKPAIVDPQSLQMVSPSEAAHYIDFDQVSFAPSRSKIVTKLQVFNRRDDGEIIDTRYSFQAIDLSTGRIMWTSTKTSKNNLSVYINDSSLILLAEFGERRTELRFLYNGSLTDSFAVDMQVTDVHFSDDNAHLYFGDENNTIVYNLFTRKHEQTIKGKLISVKLEGDDLLLLSNAENKVSVYDVKAKKIRFSKVLTATAFALSPQGDVLATNAGDIIHIASGSVRKFQPGAYSHYVESDEIGEFYFTPVGNRIVGVTRSGGSSGVHPTVFIWDAKTGKTLFGEELEFRESFTNDSANLVIVSSVDEDFGVLFDLRNGKKIKMPLLIGGIDHVYFSQDNKYVYTSFNAELKQWEVSTGKLVSRIMPVNGNEMMVQLPDNYYMSTAGASKAIHYVTPALEVISFEQLDIKYHRPDKVLKAIGYSDTALIRSYERAFQKRIQKLGIDTSMFNDQLSVPLADIAEKKNISYLQSGGTLELKLSFSDRYADLDRFNLWVNEVPLFGSKGISLRTRHTKAFDTTIAVPLTIGENILEASVINTNGTESYRKPFPVQYLPAKPVEEHLYFIGIGIDHFQQAGQDLKWSVKDIRDLANSLKAKYESNITIDTLFNQNVTGENVEALKRKLQAATVNDKVIISYSGHGLLSEDFDYYLSTYAVNFKKPEENGLPYEVLEGLMDGIAPRKKLMLIDACHSGEVDKEEMEKYVLIEKTLEDSGTRSGRKPVQTEGKLGMKNSFELMQELFVNVSRGTGATVISAAAGTQFALERGSLENGVFTYSILEYMKKNPSATVSQLKEYVNKRVSELTNGLQVPTARSETRAVDWRVW